MEEKLEVAMKWRTTEEGKKFTIEISAEQELPGAVIVDMLCGLVEKIAGATPGEIAEEMANFKKGEIVH